MLTRVARVVHRLRKTAAALHQALGHAGNFSECKSDECATVLRLVQHNTEETIPS